MIHAMLLRLDKKGFTLLELLIVIAIIAVLSAVAVLLLNPTELLRRSRDSNRISDLSTLHSALSLYLVDTTSPILAPDYGSCYESAATSSAGANCGFSNGYVVVGTSSRAIDGGGWLPVNFTGISSGAPMGTLPVDPTNTGAFVYRYAASSSLTYELNANLESSKFTDPVEGIEVTDGGDSAELYEIGNVPGLSL